MGLYLEVKVIHEQYMCESLERQLHAELIRQCQRHQSHLQAGELFSHIFTGAICLLRAAYARVRKQRSKL